MDSPAATTPKLSPYPETSIVFTGTGGVRLDAPWLSTTVEGTQFPPTEATDDRTAGADAILETFTSWPDVVGLPYWYELPRPPGPLAPAYLHARPLDEGALSALADTALRQGLGEWAWSLEDIVAASHEGDPTHCDPLASFAALRRLVLVEGMALAPLGSRVRAFLEAAPEERARRLLISLVQVSRSVTRSAQAIIAPACDLHGEAGEVVRAFARDETGHEEFARVSLVALTRETPSCPLPRPSPWLALTLDALALAARSSPLALSACLFALEGLRYDEPVWTPWQALEGLDPIHRARGVGRHSMVNAKSGHSDVGRALAASLGARSVAEVCVAARIAEICVRSRNALLKELYSSTGLVSTHWAFEGAFDTTTGA